MVAEACYLSFAQRRLAGSCTPFKDSCSKTAQEGRGVEKAIPHGRFIRPVALVHEWLDAAGIMDDPCSGRYRARGGCEPGAIRSCC